MRLGCIVFCLMSIGCATSKDDRTKKATEVTLPQGEIDRARTACAAYVRRVCACAETKPELIKDCELAKARPGALELNLQILASTGALAKNEAIAVKREAQAIASRCIEDEGQLSLQTCPRPQ